MAPHQLPADAPSPRLCLVRKTQQNPEYGFNLHAERNKSQYVGAVDPHSPAELGGLRQGDRILGVNGVLIGTESHKDVVQRIKANPSECELLVIDPEGLKWYETNGVALSYNLPNIIRPAETLQHHQQQPQTHKPTNIDDDLNQQTFVSTARLELRSGHHKLSNASMKSDNDNDEEEEQINTSPHQQLVAGRKETAQSLIREAQAVVAGVRPAPIMSPRPLLCLLRKQRPTDEFGFNLHAERNKGHFIGAVDPSGIADLAGLETGQRIVGVNGELVYPTSLHKEVVALIKRDPLETRLLVASEDVDRWYTENGIPYSFDLAIVHESARVPQSRSATVVSHQTNGTSPQSRHNSTMLDDAATNTVYIPSDVQPAMVEEEQETVVVAATAPPPESTTSEVEELQDVENAATGISATEDLLEQVFSRVKPPEVEAAELRQQNGLADALADAQIVAPAIVPAALEREVEVEETKHTITNYNSAPLTVSPPNSTTGSSHHHHHHHPHVHHNPVTTYTPASQIGTGLSSPHSDKRSLDSPDSHKDENVDIFKLSAKEARQLMKQKRKDPRLQANMTLEEKHHLIANL